MAAVLLSPTNMTANNSPSPYIVSASSIYSESWDAYKAFDDSDNDTAWQTLFQNPLVYPVTLTIDLGKLCNIEYYKIQPKLYYEDRSPNNFKLKTSISGSSYSDADTRTGITGWTGANPKTFNLISSVNARYVQLYVTQNNGGNLACGIGSLKIYGTVLNWSNFSKISGVAKDSVSKLYGLDKTLIAKVNGITV